MVSVKPWKFYSLAQLLAIYFLCMVTIQLLYEYVLPKNDQSNTIQVLGIFCLQVMLLVITGLMLREHNTTWSQAFGFRNSAVGRVLLTAFAVGFAALPAIVLLHFGCVTLMDELGLDPQKQEAVDFVLEARTVGELVLLGFVTIVMAPISEEVLFRGLLYPSIKQAGYPRLALWITSIIFAAIHMNLAALMPLTMLAVILVMLYERTGNLLAPIVVHSLFNAGNFILMLIVDSITSETGFIG